MKDIELVRSCQKADRKAQEELYARFADRTFRLSFRYVKGQVDAEDIVITSFTKVFKNINSFTYLGEGSLEGWIRKIVVNESLMWLRSRHNFNLTESLDEAMPEPDLTQFSHLEADDIYNMISNLPTGYRTVFNLNVIEGYSHQEISEMLSIAESTSRTQLFKAKSLLKKMLTQEGFHYGT